MAGNTFGDFPSETIFNGHFHGDYSLETRWYPNKIEAFSSVLQGITLEWKKCNFTSPGKINVPDSFGVYCFTGNIGGPFPEEVKLMVLYIGKASDQYLSERYQDYLSEMNSTSGRKKVVNAFQKYKSNLTFWWCVLPPIHVEVVERHLLMCYQPPANEQFPVGEKHWGKAFSS